MPNPEEQDPFVRLHQRIDEVQRDQQKMLAALTYDAVSNKPGVLPRLDQLERQTQEIKDASKTTLRSWAFDMGTYVLKVLLAALAMYLAASAKKGIVIDMVNQAKSTMIDSLFHEQCATRDCYLARSN